ncbi:MAG: hypothetical protein GAK41_00062 [Burkholderia gladioli]|nr:MAG: hypothetical protein GAK41_00062 [Burkholderia gladioli]
MSSPLIHQPTAADPVGSTALATAAASDVPGTADLAQQILPVPMPAVIPSAAACGSPALQPQPSPEPDWRAAARRCAELAAQFADAVDREARFPFEAF